MATRLFWVTVKWPLPAEDGGRQATFHLARGMADLGTEVHLLAIVPASEPRSEAEIEAARLAFGAARMSVVYRSSTRAGWLRRPWFPATVASFASKQLARSILALHAAWDPSSVIVFDGMHGAAWLKLVPARVRARLKLAHRSHNVECNLWWLAARQTRNPARRLALQAQAWVVQRFEGWLCREVGLVASVSRDDAQLLQLMYRPRTITVTPIGMPVGERGRDGYFPTRANLLFLGKMDWPPNRDGLKWFLQEVWPEARAARPDLELTIAGAGQSAWLDPYLGLPGLKFLGRVPELDPVYREASACLVPIFFGSGTRVKAIEAGTYARACVGSEIGVEGIGYEAGRSYLRAESREDWLRVLREFSPAQAQAVGLAARARVIEEFDPARVARRLFDQLERL